MAWEVDDYGEPYWVEDGSTDDSLSDPSGGGGSLPPTGLEDWTNDPTSGAEFGQSFDAYDMSPDEWLSSLFVGPVNDFVGPMQQFNSNQEYMDSIAPQVTGIDTDYNEANPLRPDMGKGFWGKAGDFAKNFFGPGQPGANAAQTAGKSAQSAAEGRLKEYQATQQAASQQAQIDLARKKYELEAPAARARNASLGSQLANAQDYTIKPWSDKIKVPEATGGIKPSNLTPEARALGAKMARDALVASLAGEKYTALPSISGPGPGAMEYFNQGVAGAGQAMSIWDLIAQMAAQQKGTTA